MAAATNSSELFRACRDGDVTTVERLLPLTSTDILNRLEPNGSSCLHVACANDHLEIVRLLLDYGSSRQIRDNNGHIPLDLVKTKEITELFPRPDAAAAERYGVNPTKQIEWLLGQDYAEALTRAIAWGCVKDRGIKKTVKKIKKAGILNDDESKESKLVKFYLNEAIEKNDPTFFLKIYTIEGPFFSNFNRYMTEGSRKQVYKKLCGKWSGYYTGAIMNNPALKCYRFSGITYRGMQITLKDFEKYKVGVALTNKAFQSTSKLRKIALHFAHREQPRLECVRIIIVYLIVDPKSGLDISSISEYPDEEEVLMVPGTCFKVTHVDKSGPVCEAHLRQLVPTDE
ncbi:unnamed protein product [Rotaria sordida]|uniref:ADP ribosyltransferase domain-containing protein n=1 Tax=Rotaria sordida TaxID=392033 RepID=A0A814R879_9BILA|nr:unnamed protein product [Rotaria sordida]CAF3827195.1 unnamed protein product [Rotaria sordida]